MFVKYMLFLFICNFCYGYKLLVVCPSGRTSHVDLTNGVVRHLLKSGHEVTYITTFPTKNPSPKLRIIDISSNGTNLFVTEQYLNLKQFIDGKGHLTSTEIWKVSFSRANSVLFHENVQKLMHDKNEHFDAVIILWMFNELYSGLASVFNCPYIWLTTTEPINVSLSLLVGVSNPAYTTNILSTQDPPFTFWQRVNELFTVIDIYYTWWHGSKDENECFHKAFSEAVAKRGRTLPPYNEVKYNASLALGNSHISSGSAMRLPYAYKQIGGYHIADEIEPLSEDLQKLMDDAQDGVIYFSLGSVMRSVDMTDDLKGRIIKVFGEIKQTVIWKFEESLNNLPKNVHIFQWTQQQSILAHKNCRIFITHGGQLSNLEAIHFGVPIIGTPIYIDQFLNINRAVEKGFGQRVDFGPDMPERLKETIENMLKNPQYKEKAMMYSAIYHKRLVPPGTELVFWVEHVVQTNGADHLRSRVLRVPIYQKLNLDIIAIVIASLFIIFKIFMYFLRSVKRYIVKIKRD